MTGDELALSAALSRIRGAFLGARSALFETRDQGHHGFILRDVTLADGSSADESVDLTVWVSVQSDVNDLVDSLAWDGVMREDKRGWALIEWGRSE